MRKKPLNSNDEAPNAEVLETVVETGEQKTPHEWGAELCAAKKVRKGSPFDACFDYRFQVADQLYGWSRQVHHYGDDSFKVSKATFLESIERALAFPGASPLLAAVPKISQDKFKNFTAKAK